VAGVVGEVKLTEMVCAPGLDKRTVEHVTGLPFAPGRVSAGMVVASDAASDEVAVPHPALSVTSAAISRVRMCQRRLRAVVIVF
jgi:hypothetical protein